MASSLSLVQNTNLLEDQEQNNDDIQLSEQNQINKNIVQSLPTNDGWKVFNLSQYQGFWYISYLVDPIIRSQNHFKPDPSHIILSSSPKSGTTWLKAIALAIVYRKQHNADSLNHPLFSKLPHHCIPFYELDPVEQNLPLLATHTSFTSLPESVITSGCKVVYICRDPKDVFVSTWYYYKKLNPYVQPPPLEEAFDLFCNGVCHGGPCWDHALGYWKASLKYPDKILFLKYEEVKDNTVLYVKKLAEFMGYGCSVEEEKDGVVEKIVSLCSFESLSNLEVNKNGKFLSLRNFTHENKMYFRKGKVGDWKNHLSDEMAARLDRIVEEKLKGSGLNMFNQYC